MQALSSTEDRMQRIATARKAVLFGESNGGENYLQDWITESWQRCLSLGLQPQRKLGFDVITSAMQRNQREANHKLSLAARSTLTLLGQAIAQTRYFAILTNERGVVVDTGGVIDTTDPRATLITRQGVDLSESAVGTTAIGATLAMQRNTWLHRGEHFFQDTQCYSCAGTPITGPNGQCVGMLDVTGIDVPERPELMHLVASSARAIENALVLSTTHALVLHIQWPGQRGGQDSEGLICLDLDGVVCAINPMARQILSIDTPSQTPLHSSDIFACPVSMFFDAQARAQTLLLPLWTGLQVEVRTSKAGKLAPKAQMHHASFEEPLKDHETTLIRQTVTMMRGNVAAAAKKLGISRATVYRKIGKLHH